MNNIFALAAQNTIFGDIWNYLYGVFMGVEKNYEHLGFEKSPLFSLRLMVLGIFVGAIIACVAMAYNKKVLGGFVRDLIKSGCNSPENAKTLAELGYSGNVFIRNAVRGGESLRRIVKCVGAVEFYDAQNAEEAEYDEKRKTDKKLPKYKRREYLIDPATDRFYIPEELRIKSEVKFEKKGSGWIATIIAIILLCIAFFAVLLVLPLVLDALNDLIGSFKS